MNENELKKLMYEGVAGYNKIIYYYINKKVYDYAHKYSQMKMDKILEDGLDMSDEDLSLDAFLFAMVKDYESAKSTIQVLYDDGDVMKDEEHLDLYGSVALGLCYEKDDKWDAALDMLRQAKELKPNPAHQGADEVLLQLAHKTFESICSDLYVINCNRYD